MRHWNPQEYLRFNQERLRPSIDLVQPICELSFPVIIDAGCGPGNSTQVLRAHWPESRVIGVDHSEEMIDTARTEHPDGEWVLGDVAELASVGEADMIFSNAVIQWLPNHDSLLASFAQCLSSRGVLAVEIPLFFQMPLGSVIDEVARQREWAETTGDVSSVFTIHTPGEYYDMLAPLFARIDMWETDYYHVMPSHQAIMEMIRSTGLKPYLDRLDGESVLRFHDQVLRRVKEVYAEQRDGSVLLPFKRLLFIGHKSRD